MLAKFSVGDKVQIGNDTRTYIVSRRWHDQDIYELLGPSGSRYFVLHSDLRPDAPPATCECGKESQKFATHMFFCQKWSENTK